MMNGMGIMCGKVCKVCNGHSVIPIDSVLSCFIIDLLSNFLCEGHAYKLFYYLVLHSRPILLDMNTWASATRHGFL